MKKRDAGAFAVLGGPATFAEPLHVAQMNLAPWPAVEAAFRGIFARQYYANHGPLVRELDARFAAFIGVEHAVCVTNGTVALTILAKALGLSGEVIVPAFTFPATVQALSWAGLTPVFCDVEPATHMISPRTVEPCIGPRTSAILGAHLWGAACDAAGLEALAARRGLRLMFDACHGVGGTAAGRRIGALGDGEAFSFHATKVLNGAEGGCITTRDGALAARLRTMRSFHPGETFAPVPLRMNGKMSEAQAAMALIGLDEMAANVEANRRRHAAYRRGLVGLPGVTLFEPAAGDESNCQYVVLEVDPVVAGASRDTVLRVLAAENVLARRHFYPGVHRMAPYAGDPRHGTRPLPATERLCERLLQLPTGQAVTPDDVDAICGLLHAIHAHGGALA